MKSRSGGPIHLGRLDGRGRPSPHVFRSHMVPVPTCVPFPHDSSPHMVLLEILDGFAAEEIDQLDDQDDDDHKFEDEGAGLVEFVDHEAVELFGGLELLLD